MIPRINVKPLAVLISPPVYDFAFYDLFVRPFGLLRIGKAFEDAGFRVRLIDCLDYNEPKSIIALGAPKRNANGSGKLFKQRIEKPKALACVDRNFSRYGILAGVIEQKLLDERPDIVLVSSGMTYWYQGLVEVVALSKRLFPQVPVVVGGVYATLMPGHCKRETGADHIVSKDTYGSLARICEKYNLPIPKCIDDDMLMHVVSKDAAAIRLNTGCPMACDYCASEAASGKFQAGDPGKTFGLVRAFHEKLGTSHFAFYDDALLAHKDYAFIPFLQAIIASGMALSFYLPNGAHLAYLDSATARLMKQAGFRDIRLGFESSSSEFHRTHDSKLEACMLGEKIACLLEQGFGPEQIGIYILAGLPGQYAEEAEETVRYVKRLGVRVRIAEYSPVPGSLLWEESVRRSSFPLVNEPLCHNNTILPMQWEGFTPVDLGALKELALGKSARA